MRLLLYGGCHAAVLRDYLEAACPGEVRCTLLVNFELIRSGAPFPYEVLGCHDGVVYSPIENKGAYNTASLRDACRRRGIPAVCFPWLEWHGYSPGAAKGPFAGRVRWHYPELAARAAAFAGPAEAFCDEVIATFPGDDAIDRTLHESTAHLRAAEERHATAFPISDAILRDYRTARLFLIPDHPSRHLYLAVLDRILACLGLRSADRLARLPGGEPQDGWRLPIFPRVARRLGLGFADESCADESWADADVAPGHRLGLRPYLCTYLRADRLGAAAPAAGWVA